MPHSGYKLARDMPIKVLTVQVVDNGEPLRDEPAPLSPRLFSTGIIAHR